MREIPLNSKKYPGLVALVDDEDYDFLVQYKWWPQIGRGHMCASSMIDGELVRMHTLIMGAGRGTRTDHKNGHPLDNQKANLRPCTHAENMRNSKSRKGSSSKFKGVSLVGKTGKWLAQIKYNGKTTHLGVHSSELEAVFAYDMGARRLHGDFAKTNFQFWLKPREDEAGKVI